MQTLSPEEILIVVFHTRQEPWEEIVRKGQFETWVPLAIESGYRIAYCFGPKPSKVSKITDVFIENLRWHRGSRISDIRNFINKTIAFPFRNYVPDIRVTNYLGAPAGVIGLRVNIWDMYMTGRWKQLAIIKYFLEKESAKFLLITTSAAYIQPDILARNLALISEKVIFAGPFLHKNTKSEFVSGAQVVINKEFAHLVLNNLKEIPVEILNDLGLSFAAKKMRIKAIELPTINFSSIDEIGKTDTDVIKNNYHFRLKSFQDGKRNDVELFHFLRNKINTIGQKNA